MQFRRATAQDIPAIMSLIQKRIDWMDEIGIEQWNKTDYLTVYPTAYFEANIAYFFVAAEGDAIYGVLAAYTKDPRWVEDGKRCWYIHHLTADPACKGLGKRLLAWAEEEARAQGVEAIRLDSSKGNVPLDAFYEALSYPVVGECVDGVYVGVTREKAL